jgi:hypothetical protein
MTARASGAPEEPREGTIGARRAGCAGGARGVEAVGGATARVSKVSRLLDSWRGGAPRSVEPTTGSANRASTPLLGSGARTDGELSAAGMRREPAGWTAAAAGGTAAVRHAEAATPTTNRRAAPSPARESLARATSRCRAGLRARGMTIAIAAPSPSASSEAVPKRCSIAGANARSKKPARPGGRAGLRWCTGTNRRARRLRSSYSVEPPGTGSSAVSASYAKVASAHRSQCESNFDAHACSGLM